jgi:hypothetical protein
VLAALVEHLLRHYRLYRLLSSDDRPERGTDGSGTQSSEAGSMTRKLYWLAFKVGDQYKLSPYRCESRQDAMRHGMEHVLDRELVAVFSEDAGFTIEEMLDLATFMQRPGSVFLRPEE